MLTIMEWRLDNVLATKHHTQFR